MLFSPDRTQAVPTEVYKGFLDFDQGLQTFSAFRKYYSFVKKIRKYCGMQLSVFEA